MTIQDQVTSLDLSKRLKELGVKQESAFVWVCDPKLENWHVEYRLNMVTGSWPDSFPHAAFTVAELGEMLPKSISTKKTVYDKNKKEWLEVEFRHKPVFGYKAPRIEYVTAFYYENGNNYDHYAGHQDQLCIFFADTEADARAKILIYLLENKLITLP